MSTIFANLTSEVGRVITGLRYIKSFRLSSIRKVFSLMGAKEKIAFLILFAIASTTGLLSLNVAYVGITNPAPADGGTYTEGMLGQPRFINPLFGTSTTDQSLVRLVFSGLYSYSEEGNLIPDLAENLPQVSDDQKQYTVKLRSNAIWHNGKKITADDIIFTIATIQDPIIRSPLRDAWLGTDVQKIDDQTVTFITNDISGPFIHNLTLPLIPRSVWNGITGSDFALSEGMLKAIGSGPYAIKEIKKQSNGKILNILMEAFDDYYTGRAHINTLNILFYDSPEDVVNALHSKEVSGIGFIPSENTVHIDENRSNFKTTVVPLAQYQAVFFNMKNKILSDVYVRAALDLASDKQKIIEDILNNRAYKITGPFIANQIGNQTEGGASHSDLEAARKTLETGGWKISTKTGLRVKNNQTLEFTLATNDNYSNSKTAEILINDWQQLNIKVNLVTLPTNELTTNLIRPRAFDALLFSQKLGADPDPFVFWHSSQIKDPGLNITGFGSGQSDKLITEARSTTKPETRTAKYQALQALIEQQRPAIFLNQSGYVYIVDSKVKGQSLPALYDPSWRFAQIAKWFIQEKRVW